VSQEANSTHVRDLRERGYTVFERVYDDAEIERLTETMARLHALAGRPECFSREARMLAPEIELCTTGLVFYKFIKRCPEHAELIVRPEVVAALRGYVGHDVELELTGAVIADSHRPFFAWHTHIGGIDDSKYRHAGVWPRFDEPQRVMTLLYVQDLAGENGPLLVYPRRVEEPTAPPHPLDAVDWPGQIQLEIPRGSVVIMDQCTWHAVRPKTSAGLRSFVGCYFRSPKAPATEWIDESLRGFEGGGDLLRSLLPRDAG
jgi:hypothetical protein